MHINIQIKIQTAELTVNIKGDVSKCICIVSSALPTPFGNPGVMLCISTVRVPYNLHLYFVFCLTPLETGVILCMNVCIITIQKEG